MVAGSTPARRTNKNGYFESSAIGAILIRRTEVRPFTDTQITLLQTFADQVVTIVGDNVRNPKLLGGRRQANGVEGLS